MGGAPEPDSAEEDDVEQAIAKTLWRNHKLIPPTSPFLKYWFSVIICLVLYNAIYIPMELCFQYQLVNKHAVHIAFDFFVDALFLTDIVINFRTVFYTEDFELVLDIKAIRKRYMRGSFWLDLFASLPYDVIQYALMAGDSSISADQLGALGLLKLPRLLRLGKLLKKVDQLSGATGIRILFIIGGFLMMTHWLACIWWLLGVAEINNASYNTDDPYFGVPWPMRLPNAAPLGVEASLAQAYLTSFYWALTMLMKTPMVGPETINEKIFACFTIAIGAILFAIQLTFVSSLTRQSQSHSAEKRDTIGRIEGLANAFNLPKDLGGRLSNHMGAFWTQTSGINNNKTLAQLPVQLRAEILKDMHGGGILHFSSLFKKISNECAMQLLAKLSTEMCLDGVTLVARGQNLDRVYMLMKGALTITNPAPAPASPAAGGGGKKPKCCGGDDSSPAPVRKSKSGKMGLTAGGEASHLLEKPGACIGGSKLFSSSADLYPYNVVGQRKSVLVSIRTKDVEAILSVFKEDAEAATIQLKTEAKRLDDTLNPGGPRRASIGAAQAVEEAPVEEAQVVETAGAQRRRSQHRRSTVANTLLLRVGTLEASTSELAQALEKIRDDLKLMPKIVQSLVEAGHILAERKSASPTASPSASPTAKYV